MFAHYISDLHRDTYRNKISDNKEFEDYVFGETAGELLFVMGDIAEKGDVVVETLAPLKKRFKHVLFVAGNHDLYVEHKGVFKSKTAIEKACILKEELANHGVKMLTGDKVLINGVNIGGSHMWYDSSYLKEKRGEKDLQRRFMAFWNMYMRDAGMLGSVSPITIFEQEITKLQNLKDEVEVFLSHVNPVPLDAYMGYRYLGQESNTFFSFDGREHLKTGKIKHFFFGHTHIKLRNSFAGCNLYCNPLGYPGENFIKKGGNTLTAEIL